MISLTKSETLQLAGVTLGIAGVITGAILLEPLVVGAGVVGAGAAVVAKLISKNATGNPEPAGKTSEQKPQTSAVATETEEHAKVIGVSATKKPQAA